jgi:hypothetical protein
MLAFLATHSLTTTPPSCLHPPCSCDDLDLSRQDHVGSGSSPAAQAAPARKRKRATKLTTKKRTVSRNSPSSENEVEEEEKGDGKVRMKWAPKVAWSLEVSVAHYFLCAPTTCIRLPMILQTALMPSTLPLFLALQEDELLRCQVAKYGENWPAIALHIEGRTNKSCRLRWIDHLDPAVNTEPFTVVEDAVVVELHKSLGNKWAGMLRSRALVF